MKAAPQPHPSLLNANTPLFDFNLCGAVFQYYSLISPGSQSIT